MGENMVDGVHRGGGNKILITLLKKRNKDKH